LIVDLREVNKHCQTRKMKMETLLSLRLTAKPGDHWVSFDLKDVLFPLAIVPKDRELFTINLDGHELQLCALPMGWSLSPYVFQNLREVFTDHLALRPRVVNHLSGDPSCGKAWVKSFKKVASWSAPAHKSPPATLHGRIRDGRRELRENRTTRQSYLRLASQLGTEKAPHQGAFSSHSGWRLSGYDLVFSKGGVPSPDYIVEKHCSPGKDPPLQSSVSQAAGQCQEPRMPSGQAAISISCYPSG